MSPIFIHCCTIESGASSSSPFPTEKIKYIIQLHILRSVLGVTVCTKFSFNFFANVSAGCWLLVVFHRNPTFSRINEQFRHIYTRIPALGMHMFCSPKNFITWNPCRLETLGKKCLKTLLYIDSREGVSSKRKKG